MAKGSKSNAVGSGGASIRKQTGARVRTGTAITTKAGQSRSNPRSTGGRSN